MEKLAEKRAARRAARTEVLDAALDESSVDIEGADQLNPTFDGASTEEFESATEDIMEKGLEDMEAEDLAIETIGLGPENPLTDALLFVVDVIQVVVLFFIIDFAAQDVIIREFSEKAAPCLSLYRGDNNKSICSNGYFDKN